MKNRKLHIIIILVFTFGCSSPKEMTMPFYNLFYTAERLFPIESNDDETVFRVWFNLGTSVERVLTVSVDTIGSYSGTLTEYGEHYSKYIFRKGYRPTKSFYRENSIKPKNGFENLFANLSLLELLTLEDREEVEIVPHEPFSIFVIEYKDKDDYNQFRFYSSNNLREEYAKDKYDKIKTLIIKEFYQSFRFD